ncbi:MAG: acyloxyacyl hydrolase [Alphaproteobacteria bacterium]|nr:acyloxyacyl hydrolase [Alphaproteobacteria bacterium]
MRFPRLTLTPAVLAIAATWATAVAGQDRPDGLVSEFRAGVLYHDASIFVSPGNGNRVERDGVDANLELLFRSPGFLDAVGSPRPHVGFTVNTEGATSQIYAGLTWNWSLSERIFLEFGGGGAVHNGETDDIPPDPAEPYTAASGDKLLGCRLLFRGSLALGVRFAERHSLSLALDHISNGYLCDPNPGLDTLGLRWGYRF